MKLHVLIYVSGGIVDDVRIFQYRKAAKLQYEKWLNYKKTDDDIIWWEDTEVD